MRKALVVGINNYSIAPLNGCINDATAFASIIETNGNGSPNFDVKLILDVQTKSELKGHIIDLFRGKCDTALFYFSGHGLLDQVGGYIVTPDYQVNDVGVSMAEILKLANDSNITNKVIILDCCHSGTFGTSADNSSISAHLAEGISIMTASKRDEVAIEVNGHGVFTNLLLHALKGGAADLRGNITPGSVYAYIDQALGAWHQRPVFKTNISSFTVLREVTPRVPVEVIRRIVEYFPTPSHDFSLNPSFEFTNSPDIEHTVVVPHAKEDNVSIFKDLQKLQSIGLVVPVSEEHMYFAAMNSKSCRLTALGYHYWRLVKEKRLK